MKKVLGISFSPRKLGNCEIAIKEIVNNIPEEIDFEFLNISKVNIKQCIACYSCLFDNGKCKLNDDFMIIFNKIIESDVLIMAVPSYFLGPNSSFKVFIDRFLVSFKYFDNLYKKKAVIITIAGVENGGEGYTDLALKTTARILNLDIVGSAVLYGALPGEILLNDQNKQILKSIAKNIFNNTNNGNSNIHCNICGSNYFEFIDNYFIRCLVCKNKGKIVIEDDKLNVYIEHGDIFYGSKEANIKHRKWLMSMKERFLKERQKLKEITKKYL